MGNGNEWIISSLYLLGYYFGNAFQLCWNHCLSYNYSQYLYSLLDLIFIGTQQQSQLSKIEMNDTDKQRDEVRDK